VTVWSAITTCNHAQWLAHGQTMAATFDRHWPPEIKLTVYAEGFSGDRNGRVRFVNLDQAAPWLAPWKAALTPAQRGITPQGYRYRWDAAKFAHKVAALGAAVSEHEGILAWLDADIRSHADVTIAWLEALMPAEADVAWLDRHGRYPETGALLFRLPRVAKVLRRIVMAYQDGQIFKLREWHDAYVIGNMIGTAEALGEIGVASLSGDARMVHHPLAAGPLGSRLDHLKGARKIAGRSLEFVGKRPEPYWQ
jgi:hypothetical protein